MEIEIDGRALRDLEQQLSARVAVPLTGSESDAARSVATEYERRVGVKLSMADARAIVRQARRGSSGAPTEQWTAVQGDKVSDALDRMWAVRDAVLRWLYILAADGNRHPTLDAKSITEAVRWTSDPLQDDEIAVATEYLKDEGYISGSATWGGGIVRPAITSYGERKAAEGTSVRPSVLQPANPSGNVFNVNNYGSGNFNVGGQVHSQQLWSQTSAELIIKVADALDQFAAVHNDQAEQVRDLAKSLRGEAQSSHPALDKLRALLGSAIGAVAISAGTEIGQQVTNLAVSALQGLS